MQNKRRSGFDDVTIVFTSVHKLHQFAALLSIGDDHPNYRPITAPGSQESTSLRATEVSRGLTQLQVGEIQDLRVLSITWNMGGSDKPILNNQVQKLLPDVEQFDLVFFAAQECVGGKITQRHQQMELYLSQKGFKNIDTQNGNISMFQMFLTCYAKATLFKDISRVQSTRIAKGKNMLVTTVGNKGGLSYSFYLRNHAFNVIGCHLQHKREKQEKRNFMSRELVNEMKTFAMQQKVPGIEADQVADFCFYLGDLNYRLDTTFPELNNNNIQDAIGHISSIDQLMYAKSYGYFPGYVEQPIDFLPTYKMSTDKTHYVNKKDQAPSYCDRVMFKSNMPSDWSADFYKCAHDMHGSDHRPV